MRAVLALLMALVFSWGFYIGRRTAPTPMLMNCPFSKEHSVVLNRETFALMMAHKETHFAAWSIIADRDKVSMSDAYCYAGDGQ